MAVLLGIAAILAGCIPSLHPLYTDKDLVFDPALIGQWSEENSKESWLFEKAGDDAYKLTYTDGEGKKGEFQAHLLKLGDLRFLDLYPEDAGLKDAKRNDFFYFHFVPVHTFIRVRQVTPTLEMSMMETKWLDELLKSKPKSIAHETVGERVILTAATKELQSFVRQHAQTAEAWGQPAKFKRQ